MFTLSNLKCGTKKKKGQAGLNIFLGVIVMIFVIGLLITVILLTSAQLNTQNTAFTRSGNNTVTEESNYMLYAGPNTNYFIVNASNNERGAICVITSMTNVSGAKITIASGNYTVNGGTGCKVTYVANGNDYFANKSWLVNYSYMYDRPNEVYNAINNTSVAVFGAVTWFPIFITISAVVTLVLLIVLIIISLRGAGLMGDGGA